MYERLLLCTHASTVLCKTDAFKLILWFYGDNVVLTQTSKNAHWLDNYLRGAAMEVYTERFSPQFHGLPFTTVSL